MAKVTLDAKWEDRGLMFRLSPGPASQLIYVPTKEQWRTAAHVSTNLLLRAYELRLI